MRGRDRNSHGGSDSCTRCERELHSSIISHILVKLPIKSIIMCKSVCKAWYRLIVDPYFHSIYSKYSPFTATVRFQTTLLSYATSEEGSCFLEIGNNDDIVYTPFNLRPFIAKQGKNYVRLIGSCNGLLCVGVTSFFAISRSCNKLEVKPESIFVINPLTGESVKVPRIKGDGVRYNEMYGFGATVDGDNYKVVRKVSYYDLESYEFKHDSKVITIGTDDEWRDIYPSTLHRFDLPDGVALNGFLHWIANLSRSSSIYAFDVGKEIGHWIPSPSSDIQGCGYLGVWDGNLCFTANSLNGLEFDIWTMRRYGVAESWTKDIVLVSSILYPNIHQAPVPRTTRRNGDLVLSAVSHEGHKCLISFDPKEKNYVKIGDVFDDKCLRGYAPCFSPRARGR